MIVHHPLLSTHRYSYAEASPNKPVSPQEQSPEHRSTCRYAEDYKSPSPSSQPRNPIQQPRTPTRKKTQYHSVRAIDKILRQDASNQKRPRQPRVTTIPSWTLPLPSVALTEGAVEITSHGNPSCGMTQTPAITHGSAIKQRSASQTAVKQVPAMKRASTIQTSIYATLGIFQAPATLQTPAGI